MVELVTVTVPTSFSMPAPYSPELSAMVELVTVSAQSSSKCRRRMRSSCRQWRSS